MMNEQFTPQKGMDPLRNFTQRHAISIKIFLIGVLSVLLLIPMAMIRGLIHEREYTSQGAMEEVRQKWSGPQLITGPVLTIPYIYRDEKGKAVKDFLNLLPDQLDIEGEISTEELKRGIFEIIVYNAPLHIKGRFLPVNLEAHLPDSASLLPGEATLNLGVSDLRGIREQVSLQWNGTSQVFNPGVDPHAPMTSGVSLNIHNASLFTEGLAAEFAVDIKLKGSESIFFAPLGKTTRVSLSSNCLTPSFTGAFLPEERETTDKGFNCQWTILDLNRNYGQVLKEKSGFAHFIPNPLTIRREANSLLSVNNTFKDSVFGVNLLTPVHQYQKTMRSVKYAFMIILLTFVVCFFVETIQKKHIHPFQYLLVGLALCLFYTLLVATSEHINFTAAYWLSAAMTSILIVCYMYGILKIKKTALSIGGLLLLLYTYIFFLTQMENYALLAGSLGLFLILAIVMFYSLKISPRLKH